MSKKFKGKLCVYCSEARSTSADHVFARKFFLFRHRMHLPKVPACDACNGQKAGLEHYLAAVLPFGGRHSDALTNLETMVPKRLDKDGKLRRALAEGQGSVWVHSQGMAIPTTTLPIDSKRIVALFGFIAKGLAWYHWQAYLGSDHFVDVLTLSSAGEKVFDERFFNLNSRHRVRANLGNGTFVYEGVQGVDCPQVTAWRISVYGGLCLAGDPADPSAVSSCIDIVTGPARVKRDADLAGRFGWQQPEVALVRLAAKRVLHLP